MRAIDLIGNSIKKSRRIINPPYKIKDIIQIFLTLVILLAIPATVIGLNTIRDFRSKAVVISVNLITNPGFENGSGGTPDEWQTQEWGGSGPSSFEWISDGSEVRNGIGSVKIVSSVTNDSRWIQTVAVEPNRHYLLKGWLKTTNVEPLDSVGANLSLMGTWTRSGGLTGTNNWIEKKMLFSSGTSNSVVVGARLGFYSSTVTGTALFDDITLEKLDPPIGQHVILLLFPDDLALLQDPTAWVQKLDGAYEALQDLVGQSPYGGDKISIEEVDYYPGGKLVAGNPILWYSRYVPGDLEAINTQNDLSFGPIHEISHDFDFGISGLAQYYMGEGPIGGEQWANFKLTYVGDILSVTYPTATFYQPPVGHVPIGEFADKYFVEKFAIPWINSGQTDWQNMPGDAYTGLLYMLKEDIGWEPFKQTFRDYATLTESPPTTDLGKVELFAHLLSKNAGADVTPYFQSWGFPIEPAPDTISPSVSITLPSDGQAVFGTIDIQANATDNVGVTGMTLLIGGQQKTTSTTGSINYSWDSTQESNGTYVILVNASDSASNIGTKSINVTVNNPLPPDDNIPPTITISSPRDGETVSGTNVQISATATDESGIDLMTILIDDESVASTGQDSLSYTWNTTLVVNKTYTILVSAVDTFGNPEEKSMQVTVNNTDLQPKPTVDIKADGTNGPTKIIYNQNTKLIWDSTNAKTCIASGAWSGSLAISGSKTINNISSKSTFTIKCDGPGGTAADSVVVDVFKQADLNKDGKVDIFDLSILLANWNKNNAVADLNNSGKVDIFDLSILLAKWGK